MGLFKTTSCLVFQWLDTKYGEVLNVCCFDKDLQMMEFGDQTEIGELGINLSGGQKQCIQLTRAVYQEYIVYLLNNNLSAVDAHTGSDIFKNCVRGALKSKAILLGTHQVDFLHNVDCILVMREGRMVESRRYDKLVNSRLDFGELVAAHETSAELEEQLLQPNNNRSKRSSLCTTQSSYKGR